MIKETVAFQIINNRDQNISDSELEKYVSGMKFFNERNNCKDTYILFGISGKVFYIGNDMGILAEVVPLNDIGDYSAIPIKLNADEKEVINFTIERINFYENCDEDKDINNEQMIQKIAEALEVLSADKVSLGEIPIEKLEFILKMKMDTQ